MKTAHNLISEEFDSNLSLIEDFKSIVVDSIKYKRKKTSKKRIPEYGRTQEEIINDLNRLTLIKTH